MYRFNVLEKSTPCRWMMPRPAVESILNRSLTTIPKNSTSRGALPSPSSPPQRSTGSLCSISFDNSRNVADPILSIPPEVLFLLIESPLQSAFVYASRCSGSLLFRIMIPSFAKSSQPSEVCISKRCERLAGLVDCKSDVWAVLQEMSENAHASVVSTSVSLTQFWLFLGVGIGLHLSSPGPKMCRTFLM